MNKPSVSAVVLVVAIVWSGVLVVGQTGTGPCDNTVADEIMSCPFVDPNHTPCDTRTPPFCLSPSIQGRYLMGPDKIWNVIPAEPDDRKQAPLAAEFICYVWQFCKEVNGSCRFDDDLGSFDVRKPTYAPTENCP